MTRANLHVYREIMMLKNQFAVNLVLDILDKNNYVIN